jgi:predicted permease
MPRSVYIALAWLFAGISVALAARYGFKTADTQTDSIIYAIMFGTIAAGGGAMQALAVHVATSADMARGW